MQNLETLELELPGRNWGELDERNGRRRLDSSTEAARHTGRSAFTSVRIRRLRSLTAVEVTLDAPDNFCQMCLQQILTARISPMIRPRPIRQSKSMSYANRRYRSWSNRLQGKPRATISRTGDGRSDAVDVSLELRKISLTRWAVQSGGSTGRHCVCMEEVPNIITYNSASLSCNYKFHHSYILLYLVKVWMQWNSLTAINTLWSCVTSSVYRSTIAANTRLDMDIVLKMWSTMGSLLYLRFFH